MDKVILRQKLKEIRAGVLDKETKDKLICDRLFELLDNQFKNANSVFVYEHMGSEVATDGIINTAKDKGFNIYIPQVDKDFNMQMILAHAKNNFPLEERCRAATGWDSQTQAKAKPLNCVAIVPLLGFNAKLHRIGYGKGCYDKFFALNPNFVKIGIAYSEQLCDFKPDIHDVPLDYVVTDKLLYSYTNESNSR